MKNRIPNLDLFRFIAIIAVLYYHVSQRFLTPYFTEIRFFEIGKYGVEMFFTLSGFLIGSIYYKNSDSVNLVKFWLQRFLRTYPPYIIALAIYYVSVFLIKKEPFNYGYLFFFQNFYHAIGLFKISWSLCVEEHFYIIYPFLVLISDRWIKNKKISLTFWIILCLLPTFIRYQFGNYNDTNWGYYITASIFRFDGIAIGCFLAFITNKYNVTQWRSNNTINILLFASLIGLAYWIDTPITLFKYTVGYLLLTFNIGLLLLSFYLSGSIELARSRVVKTIAGMAYSLYLTHALVINFYDNIYHKHHLPAYFIAIITWLSICMAGLCYYSLIEKKSIQLRNRLLNHT